LLPARGWEKKGKIKEDFHLSVFGAPPCGGGFLETGVKVKDKGFLELRGIIGFLEGVHFQSHPFDSPWKITSTGESVKYLFFQP
jgi:hypothetical protein